MPGISLAAMTRPERYFGLITRCEQKESLKYIEGPSVHLIVRFGSFYEKWINIGLHRLELVLNCIPKEGDLFLRVSLQLAGSRAREGSERNL